MQVFQRVAQHLAPGGLFVLELAHPGDLFDGTLIIGDGGRETWELEAEAAGQKLFVEWGRDMDEFDPVSQVLQRSVCITIFDQEAAVESLEEVVPYRQYTVQEVQLLAAMTGLKVVGLFGEMALHVDLNHEEAYRLVACLQKQ